MDVDDPIQVPPERPPFSLLPSPRNLNPFSLLDPNNLSRSIFDSGPGFASGAPFVSHPREVREIPIEVKDGNEQSGHSGLTPTIQEVTGTEDECGPEIHGTVIIDDEDDDNIPTTPAARATRQSERNNNALGDRPSAPGIDDLPTDYNNDIEEEMIRAAIEASKRDAEIDHSNQSDPMPRQMQPPLEDAELAHAVSLSLKVSCSII